MCKLDRRRELLKAPPYIINAKDCCKRHIKGWLERNPEWDKHPETPKMLILKSSTT